MRRIYIYQQKEWPNFYFDHEKLHTILGEVRNIQGRLNGKMETLGFNLREEAMLKTLTSDVIKSSEIEGKVLNPDQVRSSIARKLGLNISGLVPSDRNTDGIVQMMLDATQNYTKPLSKKRLFSWQASLFPLGKSGMYSITTGAWRKDERGPMQVVSGAMGKENIHFQAPPAEIVNDEMSAFIKWMNTQQEDNDPVLKAGIAHLWFVTIHPFEDGNGRIARAITDMLLARADGNSQRFYSMSTQIRVERKAYYEILEQTQKGTTNITGWLLWFLRSLKSALNATDNILSATLSKAEFWQVHAATPLNTRQKSMLNKLLDGFEGKLTSSKWAKITRTSADTAMRDIQDLINKNVLLKSSSGGRSTSYELKKKLNS